MPETFAYKVRDRAGKVVEGHLEADNLSLVAGKLRSMGYTPINIERKDNTALKKDIKIPGFSDRVKLKDVAVFSRQFATMINSGLSLLRSLSILAQQTENKALASIIDQVRQDVERGASLSSAMTRHPKAFNRLYVAMVRSGETGGVLDSVLQRLASTIEKQVELRRKVKSAMTYPVVVFCLVILIVTAMLIFIVPTFKSMYTQLGGTLPVPTRILIGASNLVKHFFFLAPVVGGGIAYGFKRWTKTESGRSRWDRLKLKAPIFGKLVHKTAIARFSRTLAALVRSGVPILESLDIVSETSNNTVISDAVHETQAAVKGGESLSKPLERHEVFPPMVVQMMAVGEETGALPAAWRWTRRP